jgi:hypothetical protein
VIANTLTLTGGSGAPSPGVVTLPDGTPAVRSVSMEPGSYSG